MPILELTAELVREIIESYGQIRKLNLSSNEISRVENLEGLSCLTKLNLFANRLGPAPEALYGLSRLSCLKELDLSENGITTLEPLSLASASMERLNVANNEIAQVDQVSFLASLTALKQLVLSGNPASDEEGYRSGIFYLLPSLQELDRKPRVPKETPSDDGENGHQSAQQCTDATLVGERIVDSPPPEEITYVSSESSDEAMQLSHRACPENASCKEGFSRAPYATCEDSSHARIGDRAAAGGWAPDMTLSTPATRRTRTAPVSEESAGATSGGYSAGIVGHDNVASFEDSDPRNGHFAELPRSVEGQFAAEQPGWARKGEEPKPFVAGYWAGTSGVPSIDSFPALKRLGDNFDVQPHGTQVRPHLIGDVYAGIDQGSPARATDGSLGHQKMGASSRRAMSRSTAIATGPQQPFPQRVEAQFLQNEVPKVPVSVRNAGRRDKEEADFNIRTSQAYLGGSSDADREQSATDMFAPTPPAAFSRATPEAVQPPRPQTEHAGRNPFEVEYPTPPRPFASSAAATVVSRNRIGSELSTIAVSGGGGGVDGGADNVVAHNSDRGRGGRAGAPDSDFDQPHVNASIFDEIQSSDGCNQGGNPFDEAPRSRNHQHEHEQHLGRSFAAATAGKRGAGSIDMRSSLPWGWGPVVAPPPSVQAPCVTSVPAKRVAHPPLPAAEGSDCGEKIFMVDRREWDALKRENDALRRQADITEKRCSALAKMQHLADRALAIEHVSRLPPSGTGMTTTSGREHNERKVRKTSSSASQSRLHDDEGGEDGASESDGVSKLLGLWRSEVLKLLLQRGDAAEQATAESRKIEQSLKAERGARVRAEAEAKALTQRALAAEAETELLGVKLERALEDLRENRTGRLLATASSSGHATAVRDLHEWVQGFVGKASEGFYEREAVLARGVAKLEAFSQRVGLAAGRLELVRTLLRRKEVQLRNSRAALVADRRVWLLERRQRELAAMANTHPQSSGDQPSSQPRVSPAQPLLEGLRPECEAVMRALFCRVDRLGTGAVRARRLLDVLRSDCGVSELMEASVGSGRWHAALNAMDARLCPTPNSDGGNAGDFAQCDQGSDERTVTWGEFLLFFLPSAGPSDDAYNAGLVPGEGGKSIANGYRRASTANAGTRRPDRSFSEAVPEDALALLQMVVPRDWAVEGMPTATSGGVQREGGLVALSVGQLRREVRRLTRERAFLLRLLQEDGRLALRRAEAVHDQYRHELRALHARIGEVESSLEEAVRRTDEERDKADSLQEELSGLKMKMEKAEHDWQRRLELAAQENTSALEASSRKAARAASVAREKLSRIEAEHALALRQNAKASVRQRALERELSRIKNSLQTEARLEKEALEKRLRAGDAKLTVARRERNALLAALRDIQRNGRRDGGGEPNPRSPLYTPLPSMDTSGTDAVEARGRGVSEAGEFTSNVLGETSRSGARSSDACQDVITGNGVDEESDTRRSDWVVVGQDAGGMAGDTLERRRQAAADGKGGTTVEGLRNSGVAASRSASLAARLKRLTAQTQELLAEDSDDDDTSCSSDDLDS